MIEPAIRDRQALILILEETWPVILACGAIGRSPASLLSIDTYKAHFLDR